MQYLQNMEKRTKKYRFKAFVFASVNNIEIYKDAEFFLKLLKVQKQSKRTKLLHITYFMFILPND